MLECAASLRVYTTTISSRRAPFTPVLLSAPGEGCLRGTSAFSFMLDFESVDMEEYGKIVVEPGRPAVLARAVGAQLTRTYPLWEDPPGHNCGHLFEFGKRCVAIANFGDDLAFSEWPTKSARWSTVQLM